MGIVVFFADYKYMIVAKMAATRSALRKPTSLMLGQIWVELAWTRHE
jgi:hypothetical protein